MKKKIFALILSVLMLVSVLPMAIFAAPSAATVSDCIDSYVETAANLAEDEYKYIEIYMWDEYSDSWNGAYINILKDGDMYVERVEPDWELEADVWIDTEPLDMSATYTFVWNTGDYDDECSVQIRVGDDTIYDRSGMNGLEDLVLCVYVGCDHTIGEGSNICENCGKACGVDYPHDYDDAVCTRCGFICGTEENPHDWNEKHGRCNECKTYCEHEFDENGVCSVCGYKVCVSVSVGDTQNYYDTLDEAFESIDGVSGATVQLRNDITLQGEQEYHATGVVFDLDGYSIESDDRIWFYFDEESTITSSLGRSTINANSSYEVVAQCGTVENIMTCWLDLYNAEMGIVEEFLVEDCVIESVCLQERVTDVSFVNNEIKRISFLNADVGISLDMDDVIIANGTDADYDLSNIEKPDDFVYFDNIVSGENGTLGAYRETVIVKMPEISDGIFFVLGDFCADSWNNAAINVFKNGEIAESIELLEESFIDTYYIDYDKSAEYELVWRSGIYDYEITFAIYVDKELVYYYSGAEVLDNGEILLTVTGGGEGEDDDEDETVEFFIGAVSGEDHVRYAEINGVVTEISENSDDTFVIEVADEDMLIEIVEKTGEGEVEKTQYFYINAEEKTATALDMESYMHSYDETSIRTKGYTGIRFKAHILKTPKFEETQFVIDEYGYIIATEEYLDGDELTLDTVKKVVGVAYKKDEGKDIVFENDDTMDVFTGVLRNIPVAQYKTDLVCKTYTKITVNGKQFVVYGEPVVGNFYDTAKQALKDDPHNNALMEIILDYEGAAALPGDELFPD